MDAEIDHAAAAQLFLSDGRSPRDSGSDSEREDSVGGAQGTSCEEPEECGCRRACLRSFDSAVIEQTQLNMAEMDRQERDLIMLGILQSGRCGEEMTRGRKRKRQRFNYTFQGEKVCVVAFRKIYGLGEKAMKNLLKHFEKNGAVPRVHGNS